MHGATIKITWDSLTMYAPIALCWHGFCTFAIAVHAAEQWDTYRCTTAYCYVIFLFIH